MPVKPSFEQVKQAALNQIDQVLAHWLPGGRYSGVNYVVRNPTRDDRKEGSFSIHCNTGAWSEFAEDAEGSKGDLIALIAYLERSTPDKAREILADFLSLAAGVSDQSQRKRPTRQQPQEWEPIIPVPANALPPIKNHYRHGEYFLHWDYKDEKGRLLCRVCRFDMGNGQKEVLPLTYCSNSKGQSSWRWKGLSTPRPIYNLNQLAKRPDALVIVTEGEKAADAASQLFPECVTTTMLNGSQSPQKADWSPLKNRVIYLWPDNDPAGRDCMDKVSRLIQSDQIYLLNLDHLKMLPDGSKRDQIPDKWDAADALDEGFTAESLKGFLNDQTNFTQVSKIQQKPEKYHQCKESVSQFQLIESHESMALGVYYNGFDRNGEPLPPLWICSPVKVTAHTRNANNENWGFLLEWIDRDGKPHVWAMPSEMTSGAGEEYRKILLNGGLAIAPGTHARNHLTTYILTQKTEARARCVETTGWHDGLYVLPDRTLGESQDRVIYQTTHGGINTFTQQGKLEQWKENISSLCEGNSRLLFAVSASFAGMLIGLVDCDSFGFHYRGDSSTGKTTALRVAASVYGGKDYMQRWRSTDNALEALASQHCDAALILDELAQIDPKSAGDVAYMLANGSGKSRANRNGTARARINWRLVYLSAGEISLADHIAQTGKRIKAGQEVRLIDLPVDAGTGHGMFEELHGQPNGAALSKHLNQVVTQYYGTPALAFIEQVQAHYDAIPKLLNQARATFSEKLVPDDAGGQVDRAAKSFALVGAAGELATRFGITGWHDGHAMQAAQTCFNAWIENRGGMGNSEHAAMLSQFEYFLQVHGDSRFTEWSRATDDHAPKTINRAGFKDTAQEGNKTTFYILSEIFRREVCEGFDQKAMAKLLIDKGYLEPDSSGKSSKSIRLPAIGNKRVYVVNWQGSDEVPENEQAA